MFSANLQLRISAARLWLWVSGGAGEAWATGVSRFGGYLGVKPEWGGVLRRRRPDVNQTSVAELDGATEEGRKQAQRSVVCPWW